jgi:hypothetical protein
VSLSNISSPSPIEYFEEKFQVCWCVHTLKYPIFPLITRALSIQKRSVNEKNDDARYAMKIEKIPNHLHTYVHNNLKQHISQK